ncbi:MAG: hypothetical protein A3E37_02750 [Candidatus Andersenbacteria bacterium RIFCSPHIGHO2_12_FULL_46_9]|nr:MAG: hypothetical protein UW94_C0007G0042 [Parcubacteria group bacterium GW2011_GWA2_45_14]OGY33037.1 MAG: hypothetical protein A3B76_01330 [Candidatus Andersenbacteria bacterium RIFCSPHIGHO2_02_FULL_46_16]OGY36521.1 MAG: hypothetical protein A3E37_02750 [Candidatus Andersenbacteria bacterium RIFCSPHIGHO2_12_FULL_46_9]OGY37122.1 MAG: hypothetical protein A3I08_02050 [Candidatus Andersenbacteria bacterium RIFCSPLOWO2_02_FULL_46_11]OGY39486.1 MAG: hypothetical protein A3G57_04195 [Candidatus A
MAIVISQNGQKAVKVDKSSFDQEDRLQQYIYENPDSIPLYDIKEDIRLLTLAREFPTTSGPIDAIGIDADGELYIIETKLYKNSDKRTVIAQALDYGAALWKHSNNFNEFIAILDEHTQKVFGSRAQEKIQDFFQLPNEETESLINTVRSNLNDGIFHFVVLMDKLDDRLKDLIIYVNQNSQFDIYAVELEYYKHDTYEIIIPRIFGAEVKKDIPTKKSLGRQWDWDSFKLRLAESGEEAVTAARQIIDWAESNDIGIYWMTNQSGSFVLGFDSKDGKKFYPFSVTGDALVSWNAWHQGDYCPSPFDKRGKRAEILERLKLIKDATVDVNKVDGNGAFKLSLNTMADKEARSKFFEVCLWIKNVLEAEQDE